MMLKRLLNLPEAVTDQRLREVCNDFDAKVYAKVRVVDVLPIENSGVDNDHYRYALEDHFDFVVTDSGVSHAVKSAKLKLAQSRQLKAKFDQLNSRFKG